jgi:uncharacterized protein
MTAVFDTNVVVSGIYWKGESYECLVAWAKRKFDLAISSEIVTEYQEVAFRLKSSFPQINPNPVLNWISRKAKLYDPALLGKQRSRDADDDIFLACALASGASVVVSKDKDLLSLEKPFGIEILTPREFLRRIAA